MAKSTDKVQKCAGGVQSSPYTAANGFTRKQKGLNRWQQKQ